MRVYSIRRENPLDFFVAVREIEDEVDEGEELLWEWGPGEKSWGIIRVWGGSVLPSLWGLLRGIVAYTSAVSLSWCGGGVVRPAVEGRDMYTCVCI